MPNFNQELKEILPINSEEKLDALFKLMSRRHTVVAFPITSKCGHKSSKAQAYRGL